MLVDAKTQEDLRDTFQKGLLRVRAVDLTTGVTSTYPLSDVMRHDTAHKNLVRVVLEDGREVTSTVDHSLFQQDATGLKPVAAGAVCPASSIVTVGLNGDIKPSQVLHVETLPPAQYTYDLCVPGPENFVLSNGILAHNSYSIGGVSLDLDKASKYEGAYSAVVEQFDKQLEKSKMTINYVKGLQQPKYGTGIRSSFGPYQGRGVLGPRKFMGL